MSEIFEYISIPFLLLVSAFFSASEIAFASVSSMRLKTRLQKKETTSLKLAFKISENVFARTFGIISPKIKTRIVITRVATQA